METDEKKSAICRSCSKSLTDDDDVNGNGVINKCSEWLSKCSLSDGSSYAESFSSDATDNFGDNDAVALKNDNVCMEDKIISSNSEEIRWDNIISTKTNQYKNIQIYESQNVHVGNVTHIHGPVYINQFAPTINQSVIINTTNRKTTFPIVSRLTWLAQPPLDPDDVLAFTEPAKFVIICHSASEEAYTQTDNNLLVRLIQQFHVESRKWNDISYNFLAGADGSIFEGRGWKIVGAHTLGYNSVSIGICFIGCYMKRLPPPAVIKKVQALIKYGVELGAIAEDYSVLAHCQCRSSESPGRRLFEEIQTWERWDGGVSVDNPSPFMVQ